MSSIPRMIAKLLSGLVIFISLPLVVWGIGDLSGFFQNPARLVYVILTTIAQVIIVTAMPSVGQNRFTGEKIVARQRLAVVVLQAVSLAVVILAPYSDRHGVMVIANSTVVRFVGLGLYLLGFVVMNLAEATLGKHFTVQVAVREGHQLITRGIYRYLRHPRYLGVLVFMIGISLIFRSWLSLIAVAALAGVLLWRIYDEEIMMHGQFGREWEDYSRKSWRLIPFIF